MPHPNKNPYETKSAVLFVIFNRPGTTQKVFDAIRAAKPKRLYIAADGPRPAFLATRYYVNKPGKLLVKLIGIAT